MGGPRPDIVFFLIDSVRPDRLVSCGGAGRRRLFLDDVLESGSLFTNAITAGPYTLIATNAIFTSLYGTTNGVNGAYKTTSDDLHPEAISLTDILKRAGYSTLCYAGSPFEPTEPVASFDVYRLMPRLDASLLTEYRAAPRPRFLCLSLQHVHDVCCQRPGEMVPEAYDDAVAELSAELEGWWRELVGPGDLALVYSDHGMRLRERVDPDYAAHPEQEPTTGVYLTEGTIRTCASFVGGGLFPRRRVDGMVRSIDFAPTLLDALGLPPLGGQGHSLWPALRDGTPPPEVTAYCETGGRWFSPWEPDVRCVRTDRTKLVRHDAHGESLFDLEDDPGETRNLLGSGHPDEAPLRRALDATLRELHLPPSHFYGAAGVDWRDALAKRPPAPDVPELSKAMNAYEGIAGALADGDLAAVARHAADLSRLLVREGAKAKSGDERAAFAAARELAEGLGGATELAAARRAFGRISGLFIAFIADRPLFGESVAAYECPEAPGYARWVQKRNDDGLVNPYLGRDSRAPIREVALAP